MEDQYWDFEAMQSVVNSLRQISQDEINEEILKQFKQLVFNLNWKGQSAISFRNTTEFVVENLANGKCVKNSQTGELLTSQGAINFMADLLQKNIDIMQDSDRKIASNSRF